MRTMLTTDFEAVLERAAAPASKPAPISRNSLRPNGCVSITTSACIMCLFGFPGQHTRDEGKSKSISRGGAEPQRAQRKQCSYLFRISAFLRLRASSRGQKQKHFAQRRRAAESTKKTMQLFISNLCVSARVHEGKSKSISRGGAEPQKAQGRQGSYLFRISASPREFTRAKAKAFRAEAQSRREYKENNAVIYFESLRLRASSRGQKQEYFARRRGAAESTRKTR